MTTLFWIICSCLTFSKRVCSDALDNQNVDKRLLLNDPDIAATRLVNLEKTVQMLTSQMSSMTQQLAEEKAKNVDQQKVISMLSQSNEGHGSSYIQWGKKKCTNNQADTIYTGFAAGQLYYESTQDNYRGGPANMLCLPNDPELSNKTAPGSSYIYGTEMQENFLAADSANEDVTCSRCRSPNTTTSIMIPGRRTCYRGWNMEYYGYVMAGHGGYRASSYICVDAHPDYVQGGKADHNGQLLYATSTKCEPLPCPPYNNNLAVYCVVCSK